MFFSDRILKLRRVFACTLTAAVAGALAGCGSSPVSTGGGGSGGTYPSVAGNWQFALQVTIPAPPALPTNPVLLLSGGLSSSGSAVTGIMRAQGAGFPPCVLPTTDLTATGKVDTAGNVTLTVPLAGGVATMAFNAVSTLGPLDTGTYQVVGGACAQASVGLSAINVPNVTGTYKGTLTQILPVPSGTAPTDSVTAVLVQASTPNSDGQFPLSGTITATGACPATLTITQGVVAGIQVQSYPSPPLLFPVGASFTGVTSPSVLSRSITGTLLQPSGCPGFAYSGPLYFQ